MTRLSVTEQLRRANPTVDSPTYRALMGLPLDPDPLTLPETAGESRDCIHRRADRVASWLVAGLVIGAIAWLVLRP